MCQWTSKFWRPSLISKYHKYCSIVWDLQSRPVCQTGFSEDWPSSVLRLRLVDWHSSHLMWLTHTHTELEVVVARLCFYPLLSLYYEDWRQRIHFQSDWDETNGTKRQKNNTLTSTTFPSSFSNNTRSEENYLQACCCEKALKVRMM